MLYFHFSLFKDDITYFASLVLQDVEELLSLPPDKVLLKWMNFHLQKAGYKKPVTNFSSDVKVFVTYFVYLVWILIKLIHLNCTKFEFSACSGSVVLSHFSSYTKQNLSPLVASCNYSIFGLSLTELVFLVIIN